VKIMKKKWGKSEYKSLIMWAAFGVAVTFTATILMFWIFQEMVDPVPMSLLIGALVGVAFKLFADRVSKE